jgi:hypothetical protein
VLPNALQRHNELWRGRRRDRQFNQSRDDLVAPKHVDPQADEQGRRQPELDKGNRGERNQALARP